MCHQSVGLIARALEAEGFPTIGLTSARTITARVNPPRSVFLDVPLGHTSGPPSDPDRQRYIVRRALELGAAMSEPGTIADLELRWHHDDWKSAPLAWSRRSDGRRAGVSAAAPAASSPTDTRTPRRDVPQYQTDDDRAAAGATSWEEHCRTCIGLAPSSSEPTSGPLSGPPTPAP